MQVKKPEHLISMREFVRLVNQVDYPQLDTKYLSEQKVLIYMAALLLIDKYSLFLAKKLELWMFLPCDEEGNVLDVPCRDELSSFSEEAWQKYSEAKKRCLFSGFIHLGDKFGHGGFKEIYHQDRRWRLGMREDGGFYLGVGFEKMETIEDLVQCTQPIPFSETAHEEIGFNLVEAA